MGFLSIHGLLVPSFYPAVGRLKLNLSLVSKVKGLNTSTKGNNCAYWMNSTATVDQRVLGQT